MAISFKHPFIPRIRKPSGSIYKILRLNRAEYGHTFKSNKKKESDYYGYYPDISQFLSNLGRYLKLKKAIF